MNSGLVTRHRYIKVHKHDIYSYVAVIYVKKSKYEAGWFFCNGDSIVEILNKIEKFIYTDYYRLNIKLHKNRIKQMIRLGKGGSK